MKLFIGGARGSSPWTDPAGAKFGGDTSSFLVTTNAGHHIVIDAGSGLRSVETVLRRESVSKKVLVLFTHYHLDHLVGLPACGLLYDPEWTLEIAGPCLEGKDVAASVTALIQPPLWPIPILSMQANISFRSLEKQHSPWRYQDALIRWCPVQHPNGCLAYRLEDASSGEGLVIATDMEWSETDATGKLAVEQLCQEPSTAKTLLFDGQYTDAEYAAYRGWGHSTWEQGIALCRKTGIEHLLITHHAKRPDSELKQLEQNMKKTFPGIEAARQGQGYDLGP